MTESYQRQPFTFEAPPPLAPVGGLAAGQGLPDALDAVASLQAAGVAVYRWTIADDTIVWSPNAAAVLGRDPAQMASGKAYATLLDSESFTGRFDAVMRSGHADHGEGVPFEIEYMMRPEGRNSPGGLWVEDHGRWYAGPDGRPAAVLGSVRRINDRHRRDQQLNFMGNCDPLTGMMNRGRMAEALGEAISVAETEGGSCALVLAAINNLSVVNEAFGFEIADEVIINMGRRLRQVVRGGDAIARYSGCKFGIILNHCDEESLEVAIKRFLEMARESVIETALGPVWALLSIGGLVLPAQAADATTAMARAEEALSEARRLPSDGYVIYRPSQERERLRHANAHNASEIVRCLREDRFLLAFQPVVGRDGVPAYHEALLRMRDSTGHILNAGQLIPIAEKLGLVRLIDRAVVQMAIATLHRYPDAKLAINISGTTATDPRWSAQITELLEPNKDMAERLVIEITETVALSDLEATRQFAEHLRGLGCAVAIDDFGAGFTSFRNLRSLPVDVLKIDGHFCSNLSKNPDNQYFVRALIDLAVAFNFKTVAEWVENEEDAALLKSWNVDYLQGNLYGAASLEPPWTAAEETRLDHPLAASVTDIEWLQPGDPALAPAETGTESAPADAIAAASKPAAAEPPAAAPPIAAFENSISDELNKLRQAIASLDASFKRNIPQPAPPQDPSLADLLSDTVMARAG